MPIQIKKLKRVKKLPGLTIEGLKPDTLVALVADQNSKTPHIVYQTTVMPLQNGTVSIQVMPGEYTVRCIHLAYQVLDVTVYVKNDTTLNVVMLEETLY